MTLQKAVQKATANEETPPKRKHVRKIVLETWKENGGAGFLKELFSRPVETSEVCAWKSLVTVHQVIHEGHTKCVDDCYYYQSYFDSIRNAWCRGHNVYAPLITEYCGFLIEKLGVHHEYPGLSGDFALEKFLQTAPRWDADRTLQAVTLLLDLQQALFRVQQRVFDIKGMNDCQVSVFVPLVIEAYNEYKLVEHLLRKLVDGTDSIDVLTYVLGRFKQQYYTLRSFFFEISNIRSVATVVAVPNLPEEPPDFFVHARNRRPSNPTPTPAASAPRPAPAPAPAPAPVVARPPPPPQPQPLPEAFAFVPPPMPPPSVPQMMMPPPPPVPVVPQMIMMPQLSPRNMEPQLTNEEKRRLDIERQRQQEAEKAAQREEFRRLEEERRAKEAQRLKAEQDAKRQEAETRAREEEARRAREAEAQRAHQARLEAERRAREQRDEDERRAQQQRDEDERRKAELERRKAAEEAKRQEEQRRREETLRKAQAERDQREAERLQTEAAERARIEAEQASSAELKQLQMQLVDLNGQLASLRELYRTKEAELAAQVSQAADLAHRCDAQATQLAAQQLQADSRDAELKRLRAEVARLTEENRLLRAELEERQQQAAAARTELAAARRLHDDLVAKNDSTVRISEERAQEAARLAEQLATMQAEAQQRADGVAWQSAQLAEAEQLAERHAQEAAALEAKVRELTAQCDQLIAEAQKSSQLMLVRELDGCSEAVNEALSRLDSPTSLGNEAASAGDVLQAIDTVGKLSRQLRTLACDPFATEKEFGATSKGLGRGVTVLLENVKGAARKLDSAGLREALVQAGRAAANSVAALLDSVKTCGGRAQSEEQQQAVGGAEGTVAVRLDALAEAARRSEQPTQQEALLSGEDLEALAARELLAAAEAIDRAANELLAAKAARPIPDAETPDVNVAIYDAAYAITKAVSALVRAAVKAQEDRQAKGIELGKTGLYKADPQWAQGLVSAAKAVGSATLLLVETANDAVNGHKSLDHVVAASKQVSAATAQLVTATRVKAEHGSASSLLLENCSKLVNDATSKLVDVLKKLAARDEEVTELKFESQHQRRIAERDIQARILSLEKETEHQRKQLALLRKLDYQSSQAAKPKGK